MNVCELCGLLEGKLLTNEENAGREVVCGYACDLLSWVMAHGREDMAWVTVQTHMNVVAVAVLAGMSVVILPENLSMEADALEKAREEGVNVLVSPLTGYEICGRMAAAGVPGVGEGH